MYRLVRPLVFAADAEFVHHSTLRGLETVARSKALLSLLSDRFECTDPRLQVERFGLKFPNPVGLAAGMDKDGRALPAWQALGFGFSEAGSVTARPQAGNPGRRLVRLPQDEAIVNRMGFNNAGAARLAERVGEYRQRGLLHTPLLINVGKSRTAPLEEAAEDYREALQTVWEVADGVVINVSSPNTPGLRSLQDPASLDRLLEVCDRQQSQGQLPVLLKLAPDLEDEELRQVAQLTGRHSVSGLVAVNTTISREGLSRPTDAEGGLSGRPLARRALEVLRLLVRETELPVVSVGGVFDADDLVGRLRAGAALVEIYTGFVYGGPATVRSLLDGLLRHLEREGVPDVESLIGIDA